LLFLALSLEQDIPDYDMDSADEQWFDSQTKSDMTVFKFEQMMDRLEKITVCSLDDAKALVRRNEVNQDVFDYWVNKRLKTVKDISGFLRDFHANLSLISETSTDTRCKNGKPWQLNVQQSLHRL
jgi:enhancer of polycomb-like protein